MNKEEESRVDAAFQEHCFHGNDHVLDTVVMKALRELGLTPSEESLLQLMAEGGSKEQITFQNFRRMYLVLRDSVPEEEQVKNALRVFDTDNTGFIDKSILYHAMTTCGEFLTEKEADSLFTNAERTMSNGFGGAVSIDAFAAYLLERHREAAKTHKPMSEPSEAEQPDEADKEMKDAAQKIRSLREIRNDEITKSAQAFPQRQQGIQELIQTWFRNSHIRFYSYDGPQNDLNSTTSLNGSGKEEFLIGLSGVCEALTDPIVQSPQLGFHRISFIRSDCNSYSTTMYISEHDGTLTDIRRLVAMQLRLSIDNVVFTLRYANTYKIIAGHSAERGGGSFLNQIFAAYTELTGDDCPTGFEIIIFRQPDIAQCHSLQEGYPMNEIIVSEGLKTPMITLSRSPGISLSGQTPGDAILFADRLSKPGESRQPGNIVTFEASPVTLSYKKKIIAVRVTCSNTPFTCRVALSANISNWEFQNNGQPLSLYQWHTEGPSSWSGFSLSASPVMLQCSKDKKYITHILCEFEQTGLYYISSSELEVVCDENFLHEKNNKTFDPDGKPRSHGGHPYLRAWGWTRKGIKIRSKKDPEPAISYLGSEFCMPDWILAPTKKHQKLSQDQTSGRRAQRGDRDTLIELSPSIQFAAHSVFFRYFSLLLSCDSQYHFETAATQPWVHIPETQSGSLIRLSVMCYAMSKDMALENHQFSHVIPTFDKDIMGTLDTYRIPTGKCRGAGLLLKRYSEAPEHALRRQIPHLLCKDAGYQFSVMDFVRMRNNIDEVWQFGYVTDVEGNDLRVQCDTSTGASVGYNYVIPDFNRIFEKKGVAQLSDTFGGSSPAVTDPFLRQSVPPIDFSPAETVGSIERDYQPATFGITTPQDITLQTTLSNDIRNNTSSSTLVGNQTASTPPQVSNAPDFEPPQQPQTTPTSKSKPEDAKSDGCCCAVS